MSALIEPHTSDHVVQFYEDDAALVQGAGAYLRESAAAGGIAIVIATEAHRAAFEAELAGAPESPVVWLDAGETLAGLMRDGRVDPDAFFDRVGAVVREAAATARPVRAYGEMVALLWEAGDVGGAIDLETLWNELGTQVPFSLYCAYRSESVAGHEHADALERVCHLHSAVVTAPPAERTWEFGPDRWAPSQARNALVQALRHRAHDGALLDDVRLVVTELAANAVVHARSSFWVSLREEGSTIRIRVGDGSRVPPAMRAASSARSSGRGLRLIDALATRWGVELERDGKVVWVELSASS